MSQFAAEFDLADLNDTNGYKFYGSSSDDDRAGGVLASGDFNGDGDVDLIVSALFADKAYVVFGGSEKLVALDALDGASDGLILFSELDGSNGFAIDSGELLVE